MPVLPKHSDLTIIHNWHKAQSMTVEEAFSNDIEFDIDQWDSELAFQKAKAMDELWSLHWIDLPPSLEGTERMDMSDDDFKGLSLFAPTFKDLMKLMLTKSTGQLIEYD